MNLTNEQIQKINNKIRKKLTDIHQYQKDTYEYCLNEGKLHRQKINRGTVYNIVGRILGISDSDRIYWINKILTEDRIKFIKRIQYEGNAYADEDSYEIGWDNGVIIVTVAPIEPDIQDNAFINDYLESRFQDRADFIKRYMAAYTFTNFKRLPTLVFSGRRGTSKSTFVDNLLRPIYPNMHINWNGLPNNFNPEVEKKLAVIDENDMLSREQYNHLKAVTGSKSLFLNQKYKEEVAVRNNLQIALIANNNVPMYVKADEYPVSEYENQWFVWKFKRFKGKPEDDYGNKLKRRLGHYIQTELKELYESNQSLFNEGRYSIKTPITRYEEKLFEANRSVESRVSERIKSEVLEDYETYIKHNPSNNQNGIEDFSTAKLHSLQLLHSEGFLTNELIRIYDLEDARLSSVTNYLGNTGILGGSARKYFNGNEYRGRYIGEWEEFNLLRDELNPDS